MPSPEEISAAAIAVYAGKNALSHAGKAMVDQFKTKLAFAKAGPLEQSIIDWDKVFALIQSLNVPDEQKAALETLKLGSSVMRSVLDRELEGMVRESKALAYAVEELPSDAEVMAIDEDWKNIYTDVVRTASTEEMLRLYGVLLASEALTPGTFSKRAVSALRQFGPFELGVLNHLSGCSITSFGHIGYVFRPDIPEYLAGAFGHNVFAISYGLLPAVGEEMEFILGPGTQTDFRMSDGSIVEFANEGSEDAKVPFLGIALTDIGADLCQVAKVDPNQSMLSWLARPRSRSSIKIVYQ